MKKYYILLILAFLMEQSNAIPPKNWGKLQSTSKKVSVRKFDCVAGKAQVDQDINNVRARLRSSGNVWFDGQSQGRYIVPKPPTGSSITPVSALYSGAVWIGGLDPSGNLKLAASTFVGTTNNFATDFYPGPLDPIDGSTEKKICSDWDRFFDVTRNDIDLHRRLYAENGDQYTEDLVPTSLLRYPGRGNPFFTNYYTFELPSTGQGLAPFYDKDSDGLYDPTKGDFPLIEIRGCDDSVYADQMFYWIYNDNGAPHGEAKGSTPIQMEVQVQAFSYATNDELNNMTFQRYKLINRATQTIRDCYFAMWADPDLGCANDDYIGCDTTRSLAFIYNSDARDGEGDGCACGTQATYCDDVPIIGIDYFRGPNDEFGNELGMSSFTYYENGGGVKKGDPENAQQYYNYLTGKWRDGTNFTGGGDGTSSEFAPIKYAFPGRPNVSTDWSMCGVNASYADRRIIQATGPLTLLPGAVNELIIGVPFVPKQDYPCPDLSYIQAADDVCQALFDNCFKLFDGPDAPDMEVVELNRELVFNLYYSSNSNNYQYKYQELGQRIPKNQPDTFYRYEGLLVYQLANAGIGYTPDELADPTKARLIYQADLKNGVSKIVNWNKKQNPDPQAPDNIYFEPKVMVEGNDGGMKMTFNVTQDQFTTSTDTRLVNNKKYYFVTLSYAFNDYVHFDPILGDKTQFLPFVTGRRNIAIRTPIPRPIVDVDLNADYGDGAIITRLDGYGAGNNYLDVQEASFSSIINGTSGDSIVYKPGKGPVQIKIYNPIDVVDGEFILKFIPSGNPADDTLQSARWILVNTSTNDTIESLTTLATINEQVLGKYGFSILTGQTSDGGVLPTTTTSKYAKFSDNNAGAIGSAIIYSDLSNKWFQGIKNGSLKVNDLSLSSGATLFNFVRTATAPGNALDPNQALSKINGGFFVPFRLVYSSFTSLEDPILTPGYNQGDNSTLSTILNQIRMDSLPNVDIVLTPNKDLWSRCVVLETANVYQGTNGEGGAKSLELRKHKGVSKEADANGLPAIDPTAPDGTGWFPGYAIDVVTGKRLNILFGENSLYNSSFDPFVDPTTTDDNKRHANGADMMWNPTSQMTMGTTQFQQSFYLGGHHFMYVTSSEYDGCEAIRQDLIKPIAALRTRAYKTFAYAAMPILRTGSKMKSYADGLIPSEVTVQLRVSEPYSRAKDSGPNNGYPMYRIKVSGKTASQLAGVSYENELDTVKVVPNPYFAQSDYEINQNSTIVKITNLPAKCDVTIYTLDGKFVRQYKRNEHRAAVSNADGALLSSQIIPDLEWDIKNNKGIPVSSGVYLIYIKTADGREKVLKWFNVARKYDAFNF